MVLPMDLGALMEKVEARQELPPPAVCKALRKMADLSQEDEARALGVSRAAVSRWENGSRRPTGTHLIAYAELMGELRRRLAS